MDTDGNGEDKNGTKNGTKIPTEIKPIEKKYALVRDACGENKIERVKKPPSAIGRVDFHQFLAKHKIHPMELAQFLKITHTDIEKIFQHGGWMDSEVQDDLLFLVGVPKEYRLILCWFMMGQTGNASTFNASEKEAQRARKFIHDKRKS